MGYVGRLVVEGVGLAVVDAGAVDDGVGVGVGETTLEGAMRGVERIPTVPELVPTTPVPTGLEPRSCFFFLGFFFFFFFLLTSRDKSKEKRL